MLKKTGQRIRKIRISKGLTLANMGEELKMTTSAYSKIERGETNILATRLIQIAEVFNINISQLFEDPIPSVVEGKNSYGYASKEEVAHLTHVVQAMLKEIEKLREDFSKKKNSQQAYPKRKK